MTARVILHNTIDPLRLLALAIVAVAATILVVIEKVHFETQSYAKPTEQWSLNVPTADPDLLVRTTNSFSLNIQTRDASDTLVLDWVVLPARVTRNMSDVVCVAVVDSTFMPYIVEGLRSEIEFTSSGGSVIRSTVATIQRLGNEYQIQSILPNKKHLKGSEATATMTVYLQTPQNAVSVPFTSVYSSAEGDSYVFIQNKNKTIEKRHIRVGARSTERVNVVGNVKRGECVVVNNIDQLAARF